MKKLKLCLFVLIVVSGLFYFLNLYSVNPQTDLILKDVLPNEAILQPAEFQFYTGVCQFRKHCLAGDGG